MSLLNDGTTVAEVRKSVSELEAAVVQPAAMLAGEEEKEAPKSMRDAILQIVIADVSMSLDNVLAVAGAARQYPYILAFGLVLSIALTAVASKAIAGLLDRYRILGYIGVAIIVYVGIEMVYDGGFQVLAATGLDETLHIPH